MFIGHDENSVSYRFVFIKSENNLVEVNTIMETNNVNFFESVFLLKPSGEQFQKPLVESNKSSKFEPRRSKRDKERNKP